MAGRLVVEVTAEQIARAAVRDSSRCAIAEAIKERHPEYLNVLVDLQTIRWTNPRTSKRYVCLTPRVAGMALVNFDQGRSIEPFVLRLDAHQVTPVVSYRRKIVANGDQLALGETERGRGYKSTATRGRKVVEMHKGHATIKGGIPLPAGHLKGGTGSGRKVNAAGRLSAPKKLSNVELSRTGARVFGRRLLRG